MLLRLAGCDEMQGYLFAKPAPREEIDRLLAEALGVRTPLRAIAGGGLIGWPHWPLARNRIGLAKLSDGKPGHIS